MTGQHHEFSYQPAPVVLVVPPFASCHPPSLACHLLQQCAHERGIDVAVVYGNLIFASMLGQTEYQKLIRERLVLEHVFRNAAFDPPIDQHEVFQQNPLLAQAASVATTWAGSHRPDSPGHVAKSRGQYLLL